MLLLQLLAPELSTLACLIGAVCLLQELQPNAGVWHSLIAGKSASTATLGPVFSLPVRTKPSSGPVRHDGRILKSKGRKSIRKVPQKLDVQLNEELAAMTLKMVNLQLSGKQVESTKDDTQLLASILAGRSHETNCTISLIRPQRKNLAPTTRSSLITSDAAADALASLERLSLEASLAGVPIYVSFYCLDTLGGLTNGIVVISNEADDLIELTTIMLRSRRAFFRESDLTKRPPLMWRFTVHHRHVEETIFNDNPNEGKLVV